MTRPYKKEAIAELPRATKRDLLRNKVVDIDAKFSKAISDILCSIGELRARTVSYTHLTLPTIYSV